MFVIVDIETTGGGNRNEKITEIAMIKHNGIETIDTFHTLLNPCKPIPPFITNLTGINDDMVKNAPKFFEVAKKIVEFSEGCTFVAHNVSFDFNFMAAEFAALGFTYNLKRLCTVQMARKVFPGYKSYKLNSVCEFLGIDFEGHHRALADATVTAKIFEKIYQSPDFLQFIGTPAQKIKFLPNVSEKLVNRIESLPNSIGVYKFLNEKNEIIYIGKSTQIQNRVKSHFTSQSLGKGQLMKEEIYFIDYEEHTHEVFALLRENELIKQLQPKYNRALKKKSFPYGIINYQNQEGFEKLEIIKISKGVEPLMIFSSKDQALDLLEKFENEFELCSKINHNAFRIQACMRYSIGKCNGACSEQELPEDYNIKVKKLFKSIGFQSKNFAFENERWAFFVKNGNYAGLYNLQFDLKSHFNIAQPILDRDAQMIIKSFLGKIKITEM